MDRRSWLWRRKSSEKSHSGEADSSGSISSHSERFSDDQALTYHTVQSPEITSKALRDEDDLSDSMKDLSEKLSQALLDIRVKEESVKQHAKVAEEAVSGWEKAETEVVVLKNENESLIQKNSVLEERIGHIDGALKECLRQLRLSREEQDQKINDVVAEKSCEWESMKSKFENQLHELESQLQTARIEASMVSDLRTKLEALEKENSILVLQLHSTTEELKLRMTERDLSVNAAEIASKQRFDSIKKAAKLEAECRRLKAVARRAAPANDHRCGTASSVYVESFTDSHSDSGDRLSVIETESCEMSRAEMNEFKKEKSLGRNVIAASAEITLMDDFLEMERLVAQPEMENGRSDHTGESAIKAELEAMIDRAAQLEEKLQMIEAEKIELESMLNQCQNQLKISRNKSEETELRLEDVKAKLLVEIEKRKAAELAVESTNIKLKESTERLEEMEADLVELQTQLTTTSEAKHMAEVQLEATISKKNIAESQLVVKDLEMRNLLSNIGILEKEVENERALSNEAVKKCETLENEISRLKSEVQHQKTATIGELQINQDKEMKLAAHKFSECQKTIASLSRQLKTLATLEDFLI